MDFLAVLQTAGFVQGLILGSVLLTRRRKGNGFLAIFLFLFSLMLALPVYYTESNLIRYPWILFATGPIPFVYGPLVYLYFHTRLCRDQKPVLPLAVHLVPFLLGNLVYGIWYAAVGQAGYAAVITAVFRGTPPLMVVVTDGFKYVSGIVYSLMILRLQAGWRRDTARKQAGNNAHRWFNTLAGAFVLCWSVVILRFLLSLSGLEEPLKTTLPLLLQIVVFTGFLYVVTFFALRYPEVLDPRGERETIRERLKLSVGETGTIRAGLEALLAKGIYRNPDLALPAAARLLGVHPNTLSFVINEEYGINFRELLNQQRLEDFLSRAEKNIGNDKILSLALDSGFASKTTFNRVFKEKYGQAPTEFLKK
jgi:AraC-like DNA-binding protein